jgi:hypothetical protein
MSQRRPYMSRDDGQHYQQKLPGYLPNVTQALDRLPRWATAHERERLRQLRLRKPQSSKPCYPQTLAMPKTQQEGANR